MEKKQLEKFNAWFDDYVKGFYCDDPYINANIKLKEDHSKRVCDEMRYLVDNLHLAPNQKRLADAIALFHDLGRFEQFSKYRTYKDHISTNHSILALDVMRKNNLLADVPDAERQIIEKAIEFHGAKELPEDLNGDCLLFSRLIRDADKLDIFYVVLNYYKKYRDNPKEFQLEIELPDGPGYSVEVVDKILAGERLDYRTLRTWNDIRLCQLSWVYDVNYTATLKRIKERKFLEMVLDFLPETGDIEKVKKKIFDYVDSRIEKNQ